jgi:hypothetical protein
MQSKEEEGLVAPPSLPVVVLPLVHFFSPPLSSLGPCTCLPFLLWAFVPLFPFAHAETTEAEGYQKVSKAKRIIIQ